MTTRKFYYLLMVIAFSPFCLFGQIPLTAALYGNDPNWSSTKQFTENFSTETGPPYLGQWLKADQWPFSYQANIILTVGSIPSTFTIGDIVIQNNTGAAGILSAKASGSGSSIIILNQRSGQFNTTDYVWDIQSSNSSIHTTPSAVDSDYTVLLTGGSISGSFNKGDVVTQGSNTGIFCDENLLASNSIQIYPTNNSTFTTTTTVSDPPTGAYTGAAKVAPNPTYNVAIVTTAITGSYTAGMQVYQGTTQGTLLKVISPNGSSSSPNVLLINCPSINNFTTASNITATGFSATPTTVISATYYADCGNNANINTVTGMGQVLQIQATNATTYFSSPITSGQILTSSTYGYGYYEAYMQLNGEGVDYNDAFWMEDGCGINALNCEMLNYSTNPPVAPNSSSPIVNYHTSTIEGTCSVGIQTAWPYYQADYVPAGLPPTTGLGGGFHTYSFEWMPDHVIWYFDGIPFRELHAADGTYSIPNVPMQIYLELGLGPPVFPTSRDQFPGNMYVKYVYAYQLSTDGIGCSAPPKVFANNAAIQSYYSGGPAVESTIQFGNSTSTSLYLNYANCGSSSFYFRAAGGFTIPTKIYGYTFTVPSGVTFQLIPTGCPN